MNIKTHIEHARALLKKGGHNLTDICKAANVDPATIWKLQTGKRKSMSGTIACRLELASPNGEFVCEELSPDAALYKQVLEKRERARSINQAKPTESCQVV